MEMDCKITNFKIYGPKDDEDFARTKLDDK